MNLNQQTLHDVWWSIFWRWTVYGTTAGFVAGGLAGLMAPNPKLGMLFGFVAGLLVSIPVSKLAVRQALTKHVASLSSTANEASA